MTVVAARELDDLAPPGGTARETDRGHRGLRPRGHEANLLDVRHHLDHEARELDLELAGRSERRSLRGRLLYGLHDRGMGVSEEEGSPRLHEVDAGIAVDVRQRGALGTSHEERVGADRIERAHW